MKTYPATWIIATILRVLSLLAFAVAVLALAVAVFGLSLFGAPRVAIGLTGLTLAFWGIIILALAEAIEMMRDIAINTAQLVAGQLSPMSASSSHATSASESPNIHRPPARTSAVDLAPLPLESGPTKSRYRVTGVIDGGETAHITVEADSAEAAHQRVARKFLEVRKIEVV